VKFSFGTLDQLSVLARIGRYGDKHDPAGLQSVTYLIDCQRCRSVIFMERSSCYQDENLLSFLAEIELERGVDRLQHVFIIILSPTRCGLGSYLALELTDICIGFVDIPDFVTKGK